MNLTDDQIYDLFVRLRSAHPHNQQMLIELEDEDIEFRDTMGWCVFYFTPEDFRQALKEVQDEDNTGVTDSD